MSDLLTGPSTGVSFDIEAIRLTSMDGAAIVRAGRFSVRVVPIIESGGRNPYTMDRFQYFEFELQDKRFLRWLDLSLPRLLRDDVATEWWTTHTIHVKEEDGVPAHDVPDPNHPWIHWLFPLTRWKKSDSGLYAGRTHTSGPHIRPDDYPDGFEPMADGGFWKTDRPPPTR